MNHHYPILNLYSAKLLSYLVLLFRFNCHRVWDARLRIQIHKIKVKSRAVHNVLCGCSVTTVPNLSCNPPDCVGVALGPITIILFHMPLARICRVYIKQIEVKIHSLQRRLLGPCKIGQIWPVNLEWRRKLLTLLQCLHIATYDAWNSVFDIQSCSNNHQ